MTKSEFKNLLKKDFSAFRKYYLYEIIILFLLLVMVVANVLLTSQQLIPNFITIINSVLILLVAVPVIVIDLQHDRTIKSLYQSCVANHQKPEYHGKTKVLQILLAVSAVAFVVSAVATVIGLSTREDQVEASTTFTTSQGDTIETRLEDFGGFSLQIPTAFQLMSDEMISVKYPNGNPPSLVYTNADGTVNVALVMNDTALKNTQVEEYTKLVESTYQNYTDDIKINFSEKDQHKIGELELWTEAQDTAIYNRIATFSVNDKLRIVSFNCTKALADKWATVGQFIIDSLRFE